MIIYIKNSKKPDNIIIRLVKITRPIESQFILLLEILIKVIFSIKRFLLIIYDKVKSQKFELSGIEKLFI